MKCEIAKNIYWVGAVDWNVRNFHGHTYTTKRGTTYNAYLIVDEKITLVDTVHGPFAHEMFERIREIVPVEKIDYLIANHVETDHSGAIADLVKLCPKIRIFGTQKCKEGLQKHYYGNWDFQVVKSLEKLKIGSRSLTFLEAPMLHWPDSMFTYLGDDQILMPNDAFGQHYASSRRFDDEVPEADLMDEAAKYYANILWSFSGLVVKKIEEVVKLNIPIRMIAPSHGIIWRKDPGKIIGAYTKWGKNDTENKVVIAYETMWGATEKIARAISEGISSSGMEFKIFDLAVTDRTEVIKEMLSAKGYLIGSSTHNNGMLTNAAGFIDFLKGLKPKNRLASVFGSFGWAGGAVKEIEKILEENGIKIAQPGLSIQYMPSPEELKRAFLFGQEFSRNLL